MIGELTKTVEQRFRLLSKKKDLFHDHSSYFVSCPPIGSHFLRRRPINSKLGTSVRKRTPEGYYGCSTPTSGRSTDGLGHRDGRKGGDPTMKQDLTEVFWITTAVDLLSDSLWTLNLLKSLPYLLLLVLLLFL